MLTARNTIKIVLALTISGLALIFPTNIRATSGNGATCQVSTTCTVGEFLYDDSYVAITGATCTITSKKPDGSSLLTSASMTGNASGWYSYNISGQTITGLYPTEVRCVTGGETLAIDKSFQVIESVENSVWNAPKSSHTTSGTFGEYLQSILPSTSNIASAVWGYSDRTLTSFGSIVSDVASNNSTNNTTQTADIVSKIRSTLISLLPKQTQVIGQNGPANSTTIIQQLAPTQNSSQNSSGSVSPATPKSTNPNSSNKPTIKFFLEESKPKTSSQLDDAKRLSKKLSENIVNMKAKVKEITTNFKAHDNEATQTSVNELIALVGDSKTEGSFVFQAKTINTSWNFQNALKIYTSSNDLKKQATTLSSQVSEGKQLSNLGILSNLSNLEKLIGKEEDSKTKPTLFGQINKSQILTDALDVKSKKVDTLLSSLKMNDLVKLTASVNNISKEIAQGNSTTFVLGANTEEQSSPEKQKIALKNQILELAARLNFEKMKLIAPVNKAIANFWLEEGSIIFKSEVTNPSSDVSQTYTLQYYLPEEVKKEDVIKTTDGLEVKYDVEKNLYYISGDIVLAGGEQKTLEVEVKDVFRYSDEEVSGIRKQAQALAGTLKNTPYNAQGITLQTDIEVALDKIVAEQNLAVTPEDKIKTFRNVKIEYKGVEVEVGKLKEISAQASTANSLTGFVGGSQAIAVFGLIIIMVAGFVFLALYMRTLRNGEKGVINPMAPVSIPVIYEQSASRESQSKEPSQHKVKKRMSFNKFATLILMVGSLSALGSGVAVSQFLKPETKIVEKIVTESQPEKVLGAQASNVASEAAVIQPSPNVDLLTQLAQDSNTKGRDVMIVASPDQKANVYSSPKSDSSIVLTQTAPEHVSQVGEFGTWKLIKFLSSDGKTIIGWVSQEFVVENQGTGSVEDASSSSQIIVTSQDIKSAKILPTVAGSLRVRDLPGGRETTQVMAGEEFPIIGEEALWYQIALNDGSSGWVMKKYVEVGSL